MPGKPLVDYDQGDIHRTYAAGRALGAAQLEFWAGLLKREVGAGPLGRVVDLGCGVGRFSPLLRETFGAAVIGIDRSGRMLAAAAAAAGLTAQRLVTATNPVAPDLRTYARRVASRTISTLQLVPDDEFARGVEAFTRFCEREDRDAPVLDPIDVFVLRR